MKRVLRRTGRFLLILLIAVSPVVGIVLGHLLHPQQSPEWTIDLEEGSKCEGIILDELSDFILISSRRPRPANVQGICLKTGNTLFHRTFDDDLGEIHFIPGTTYLLYTHLFNDKVSRVYDWINSMDISQPSVSSNGFRLIRSAEVSGDLLLINSSGFQSHVYAIRLSSGEIICETDTAWRHTTFLSPDGCCSVIGLSQLDETTMNITYSSQVLFFDPRHHTQELMTEIQAVRWLQGGRAFLALQRSSANSAWEWHRYEKQGSLFVQTGKSIPEVYQTMECGLRGSYQVETRFSEDHPVRAKLINFGNNTWKSWVNRMWPRVCSIKVYRNEDDQLVQEQSFQFMPKKVDGVFPTPNATGVILQNDSTLSYWVFQKDRLWYGWIGLGCGVLLSCLLMLLSQRWQPRTSQAIP